jgi:NAD(P)-dependent dehydrogenase (short-subunit alcohol dehydrogenase family)
LFHEILRLLLLSYIVVVAWSPWLAIQLQNAGVGVVSLCPGVTDTALSAAMLGYRAGDSPSQAAALIDGAVWGNFSSGTYLEGGRPRPAHTSDLGHQRRLALLIAELTGRRTSTEE